MKMTNPARSRFFSLGASISRLTWASDSSPDIARIEWPKAIIMPNTPRVRASGKFLSHPSESSVKRNSRGGRCAPRTNIVIPHHTIITTAITVVICMIRIALPLDSSIPRMFCRQKYSVTMIANSAEARSGWSA